MSGDFENWDNRGSRHVTPPDVERVFQSARRRERRKQLLIVAVLLLIAIFGLWQAVKGGAW